METKRRNDEKLVQINPKVSESVRDEFKEFVKENEGKLRNEFGKSVEAAMIQYMENDRLARVERKLDALLQEDDEERETPKLDSSTSANTPAGRVQNRVEKIKSDLSKEGGATSRETVERCIREHAGHSDTTIKKYVQRLQDEKALFPNPTNADRYFLDAHDFVLFVEKHTYGDGEANVTEDEYKRLKNQFGKDWWDARVEKLPDKVKREIGVDTDDADPMVG
jgi:hypothetical protein